MVEAILVFAVYWFFFYYNCMSRFTLHPHFLKSFDPALTVDFFWNFIWDNNVKKELKHSFIFNFYCYYVASKLYTSECHALKLLCSFIVVYALSCPGCNASSVCKTEKTASALILGRISPYSVRIRENMDQNNSKYG